MVFESDDLKSVPPVDCLKAKEKDGGSDRELSSVRLADIPSLSVAPGRDPVDLSFGTHYQIA